jgi:hypothetical protein
MLCRTSVIIDLPKWAATAAAEVVNIYTWEGSGREGSRGESIGSARLLIFSSSLPLHRRTMWPAAVKDMSIDVDIITIS